MTQQGNTKRVTVALALTFGAALAGSLIGAYALVIKKRAEAGPKTQVTLDRAAQVQAAAARWQGEQKSPACPDVVKLAQAGLLSHAKIATDGWGHPFKIECGGGAQAVRVISPGADGIFGKVDGVQDDLP